MQDLIPRAAADLAKSKHAIALTGAGMSTESGIPDFRGPKGIWTRDPAAESRAYRSYERFVQDPKAWWQERLAAPNLLGDLSKVAPNPGHLALAELERMGVLKSLITQNVDGLHEKAGNRNVLEYHGSLLKLRCTACTSRFSPEEFDLDELVREDRLPPRCPKCEGVVKTDGVAFGEPIPEDVAHLSLEEAQKCDLMLICGTSAVVYPFAELPRIARTRRMDWDVKPRSGRAVTIIEVNAEPTPLTREGVSDYIIPGKTGEVLPQIVAAVRKLQSHPPVG